MAPVVNPYLRKPKMSQTIRPTTIQSHQRVSSTHSSHAPRPLGTISNQVSKVNGTKVNGTLSNRNAHAQNNRVPVSTPTSQPLSVSKVEASRSAVVRSGNKSKGSPQAVRSGVPLPITGNPTVRSKMVVTPPKGKVVTAKKRAPSASTLKSQLKKEIESLKRAKLMKIQQQKMEILRKEKALQQQKRAEEEVRIKQRKEEERKKREEERRVREQAKIKEMQEKARLKREEREQKLAAQILERERKEEKARALMAELEQKRREAQSNAHAAWLHQQQQFQHPHHQQAMWSSQQHYLPPPHTSVANVRPSPHTLANNFSAPGFLVSSPPHLGNIAHQGPNHVHHQSPSSAPSTLHPFNPGTGIGNFTPMKENEVKEKARVETPNAQAWTQNSAQNSTSPGHIAPVVTPSTVMKVESLPSLAASSKNNIGDNSAVKDSTMVSESQEQHKLNLNIGDRCMEPLPLQESLNKPKNPITMMDDLAAEVHVRYSTENGDTPMTQPIKATSVLSAELMGADYEAELHDFLTEGLSSPIKTLKLAPEKDMESQHDSKMKEEHSEISPLLPAQVSSKSNVETQRNGFENPSLSLHQGSETNVSGVNMASTQVPAKEIAASCIRSMNVAHHWAHPGHMGSSTPQHMTSSMILTEGSQINRHNFCHSSTLPNKAANEQTAKMYGSYPMQSGYQYNLSDQRQAWQYAQYPYIAVPANHNFPLAYPHSHIPYSGSGAFSQMVPGPYSRMTPGLSLKKQTNRLKRPTIKPLMLHNRPLVAPSPFALSHILVKHVITITKSQGNCFGVDVKYETTSALVDNTVDEQKPKASILQTSDSVPIGKVKPPIVSDLSNIAVKSEDDPEATIDPVPSSYVQPTPVKDSTSNTPGTIPEIVASAALAATECLTMKNQGTTLTLTTSPDKINAATLKKKRKRRKRVYFGVMKVVNATKQNSLHQDGTDSEELLQEGDIILSISGNDICGMPFSRACSLFSTTGNQQSSIILSDVSSEATSSPSLEEKTVKCILTVGRRKPQPKEANIPAVKPVVATNSTPKHQKLHDVPTLSSTVSQVYAPPPIPLVPFICNLSSGLVISGEFTNEELNTVVRGMFEAHKAVIATRMESSCMKMCNYIKGHFALASLLKRRDSMTLFKKWSFEVTKYELDIKQKADSFWKEEWKKELKSENTNYVHDAPLEFLTDAQRSSMRALPRPVVGCKCGSTNHEHVNHPKCVLFRNLRLLASKNNVALSGDEDNMTGDGDTDKVSSKQKLIESAYHERLKKIQKEKDALMKEAMFVDDMERVQVSLQKLAVFAPGSLAIMILSAVAELNDKFQDSFGSIVDTSENSYLDVEKEGIESIDGKKETGSPEQATEYDSESDDSSDEEDGDDILNLPLTALAKLKNETQCAPSAAKRPRLSEPSNASFVATHSAYISPYFLAELLLYISRTWGHVYQEPSHIDYAWRLYSYHCHNKDHVGPVNSGTRLLYRKNPRESAMLSLENIRFALNGNMMSRLQSSGGLIPLTHSKTQEEKQMDSGSQPIQSQNNVDEKAKNESISLPEASTNDQVLVTHLASRMKSGIWDEILILLNSNVLWLTSKGALVLNPDWTSKIDSSAAWESGWTVTDDDREKLCIHMKIREGLTLMQKSRNLEAYQNRKNRFEERYELRANQDEGIGKFGV